MNLLAVSSFRPLDDCLEVAQNQIRANRSWAEVFSGVVLFGDKDHRLHGQFIPCEQFPRISLLVAAATIADDPVAILNCDIVVTGALKWAVQRAFERGALAVTSKRYEFDPATEDYDAAKIRDTGVDFFLAYPYIWRQVLKIIPTGLRQGCPEWDSYMLGAFNHLLGLKFMDITSAKAVFHPRHGNRGPTPGIDVDRSQFVGQAGFPMAI